MERDRQRPTILLVAGVVLGSAIAVIGLLRSGRPTIGTLPPGTVALVNGAPIRLEDYQRAINGLVQDRRSGIDAAQRQLVLDRLIEEELLVQRAIELDLARTDPKLRRALTSTLVESIIAGQDSAQPSDAELQTFYERDRGFFTSPGQLHVRQIWFAAPSSAEAEAALARAEAAVRRLRAGEDFEAVRDSTGDRELAALPNALLPVTKLSDYLGPTALRTALSLEQGAVSDPVRSATGYHVLQVVERSAAEPPPFETIKAQVLAEFRRRAADQALRTYLDDLRSRAEVTISPSLP